MRHAGNMDEISSIRDILDDADMEVVNSDDDDGNGDVHMVETNDAGGEEQQQDDDDDDDDDDYNLDLGFLDKFIVRSSKKPNREPPPLPPPPPNGSRHTVSSTNLSHRSNTSYSRRTNERESRLHRRGAQGSAHARGTNNTRHATRSGSGGDGGGGGDEDIEATAQLLAEQIRREREEMRRPDIVELAARSDGFMQFLRLMSGTCNFALERLFLQQPPSAEDMGGSSYANYKKYLIGAVLFAWSECKTILDLATRHALDLDAVVQYVGRVQESRLSQAESLLYHALAGCMGMHLRKQISADPIRHVTTRPSRAFQDHDLVPYMRDIVQLTRPYKQSAAGHILPFQVVSNRHNRHFRGLPRNNCYSIPPVNHGTLSYSGGGGGGGSGGGAGNRNLGGPSTGDRKQGTVSCAPPNGLKRIVEASGWSSSSSRSKSSKSAPNHPTEPVRTRTASLDEL